MNRITTNTISLIASALALKKVKITMISRVICYSGYKIRESHLYNFIIGLCINIYIGSSHDLKISKSSRKHS